MPVIKRAQIGGKWLRAEKRAAIYVRDNYRCIYCDRTLEIRKYRTIDHVIPVKFGGSNHSSNLVTCCLWCNTQKRDKDAFDFLTTDVARERLLATIAQPLTDYHERSLYVYYRKEQRYAAYVPRKRLH